MITLYVEMRLAMARKKKSIKDVFNLQTSTMIEYVEKFEFEINEHIMPPHHVTPRQMNTVFTRTQP